jgi:hypothetical protein
VVEEVKITSIYISAMQDKEVFMRKTIYTLIMSVFILLFNSCGGGSDNNSGTSINQAGENLRPIAVAGDNQTVFVGDSVQLDASNSYDPDKNYPLNYDWQMACQIAHNCLE